MTKKIQEGYLLIHWQSSRRQASGVAQGGSAAPSEGPPKDATSCTTPKPHSQENYFTHVPVYYLSPWRPTFALFKLTDGREIGHLPTLHLAEASILQGCYHLSCCFTDSGHLHFIGVWEFLNQLNLESNWHIQMWWASESTQPTHQRCRLHAAPSSYPPVLVWNGTSRGRRRPLHELHGAPSKRVCRRRAAEHSHSEHQQEANVSHADTLQSDETSQEGDTDEEADRTASASARTSGTDPNNESISGAVEANAHEAELRGVFEQALDAAAADMDQFRGELEEQQRTIASSSSSSTSSSSSSSTTSREPSPPVPPPPDHRVAGGGAVGGSQPGHRRLHPPISHSWGCLLSGPLTHSPFKAHKALCKCYISNAVRLKLASYSAATPCLRRK